MDWPAADIPMSESWMGGCDPEKDLSRPAVDEPQWRTDKGKVVEGKSVVLLYTD
jgi:hypothetical protein